MVIVGDRVEQATNTNVQTALTQSVQVARDLCTRTSFGRMAESCGETISGTADIVSRLQLRLP